MVKRSVLVVLTLLLVLTLSTAAFAAVSGPGVEQNNANQANNRPHVKIEVNGSTVTLTFENPTNLAWSFDYQVDGEPAGTEDQWTGQTIAEGPLAGQDFGLRYNKITFTGPGTETIVLQNVSNEVRVRLARGAEQNWFFDWISIKPDAVIGERISNTLFATVAAAEAPQPAELLELTWVKELPESVQVGKEFTSAVQLVNNTGKTFSKALIVVEILKDGQPAEPDDFTSTSSTGWNLGYDPDGHFFYYGPRTGFAIGENYDVTTTFTNVIHEAGVYDIKIYVVDLNSSNGGE